MQAGVSESEASRIPWPDADPDERCEKIDQLVGAGNVPRYQFYNVGWMREISPEDERRLRRQFFADQVCDRFDLELHQGGHGGNLLRVRGATRRRLTAVIAQTVYPLVAIGMLDKEHSLQIHRF